MSDEDTNIVEFKFQGRNIVVEVKFQTNELKFKELETHAAVFIESQIKKLKEVDKE